MADQQIPPEMLAQLAQNGGAAAPAPDPSEQLAHDAAMALLTAVKANAENATLAGGSAGEAKDFAQAALYLAQAVVVLDPNLTQSGEPLDHQIALEQARADGQLAVTHAQGQYALEQAKTAAAAPTPSRSISVKRDGTGRATSYKTEG